ncbi:MAG: hypothetical protein AAF409_18695 [Pseudomonadota bacterium]
MSGTLTATVLLEQPVDLDIAAIAAAVSHRFPQIGHVKPGMGQYGPREVALLQIDGAHVAITLERWRCVPTDLTPDLRPVRGWNCKDAVEQHRARLTVSCGGQPAGLEWAKAQAAAVHFVTAALLSDLPALAVLWGTGYVLAPVVEFSGASKGLLAGRIPMPLWLGFATVVPKGFDAESALGVVTYGLRPFVGYELELAPRPCTANEALGSVAAIARKVLNGTTDLKDGERLTDGETDQDLTVRERNFWLRRDLSARVLVAPDAVVEVESLRPRPRRAAA